MHSRIKHFIILMAGVCNLRAEPADSVKSYLWGLIQITAQREIKYETGYAYDKIFHRREFHEPISFLPTEVRYGVFFYGGGTDDNVSSGWIQYDQNVSGFDGGDFQYRVGHQLDIDFLKTNLFNQFLQASWLDMQTGINFRYSNIFVPGKIDQVDSWGNINPSWDPGYTRFAPRVFTLGISHTAMVQWFEFWYIDWRYTWGYAFSNLYMNQKDEYVKPPGFSGPAMSFSIGPRFIISLGQRYADDKGKDLGPKKYRFATGLDLRYAYTKLNTLDDPEDMTPINQIHLQDFGIHLTFSVVYGGALTTGDKGKDYFFRGDFVSANEYFATFLKHYPEHANRKKAEYYLAESWKNLPLQLYREGLEFEKKGLNDQAIQRYIEANEKASGEIKNLVEAKLNHIAMIEIERAEWLAANGQAAEAISIAQLLKPLSKGAEERIPAFEAMKYLNEAEKALQFGFYSQCLQLLEQAQKRDPDLEFAVNTLRYQVATHFVEIANQITDHSELRAAIQLLKDARELAGGLGEKNESILNELMSKFEMDQQREMADNIELKMELVRQRSEKQNIGKRPEIGMTIPEIQEILGEPKRIIDKTDENGQSIQLWIYHNNDGKDTFLSFKQYRLFKIE